MCPDLYAQSPVFALSMDAVRGCSWPRSRAGRWRRCSGMREAAGARTEVGPAWSCGRWMGGPRGGAGGRRASARISVLGHSIGGADGRVRGRGLSLAGRVPDRGPGAAPRLMQALAGTGGHGRGDVPEHEISGTGAGAWSVAAVNTADSVVAAVNGSGRLGLVIAGDPGAAAMTSHAFPADGTGSGARKIGRCWTRVALRPRRADQGPVSSRTLNR